MSLQEPCIPWETHAAQWSVPPLDVEWSAILAAPLYDFHRRPPPKRHFRVLVPYLFSVAFHLMLLGAAAGFWPRRFEPPRFDLQAGGAGEGSRESIAAISMEGAFLEKLPRPNRSIRVLLKPPPKTARVQSPVPTKHEAARLAAPHVAVHHAPDLPETATVNRSEKIPPANLPRRASSRVVVQRTLESTSAQSPPLPRKMAGIPVVDQVAGTVAPTPEPSPRSVGSRASRGSARGSGGTAIARLDGLPSGLTSNPIPRYPPDTLARGVEGLVLLRVQVREDGSVAGVQLHESSGDASLDESALSTVRDTWRFAPGRRGAVAVPCEVLVPIRFRARDNG